MTTPQDQLIKKIQVAVADSPELQKQLTAVTSTEQAATLLTSAMGLTVTTADLDNISDALKGQMTDAQLDAVAAGGVAKNVFIVGSVLAFGGCLMQSALYEIQDGKGGCKRWMEYMVNN